MKVGIILNNKNMIRVVILWCIFGSWLTLINLPFWSIYKIDVLIVISVCYTLGLFLAIFVDSAASILTKLDNLK